MDNYYRINRKSNGLMTNLPVVLKSDSSEVKKINPRYIESTPVVIEQLCHCHIYSEITQ